MPIQAAIGPLVSSIEAMKTQYRSKSGQRMEIKSVFLYCVTSAASFINYVALALKPRDIHVYARDSLVTLNVYRSRQAYTHTHKCKRLTHAHIHALRV